MKSEVLEKIGIKVKNPDNVIKFLPILSIIDNESLENKIKILKFHKIPISKLSQLKILALESSELERRITVSKSNNFFTEVILNPLILMNVKKFKLNKIKEKKIEVYKPVENKIKMIPIKIEEPVVFEEKINVDKIITNTIEDEFDKLLSECTVEQEEVEFLEHAEESNEVISNNFFTGCALSEEDYDRYEKLSNLVNNILQTIDFNLVSRIMMVDENLTSLILENKYSDYEILLGVLSYNSDLTSEEGLKLRQVISMIINNNEFVKARAA